MIPRIAVYLGMGWVSIGPFMNNSDFMAHRLAGRVGVAYIKIRESVVGS